MAACCGKSKRDEEPEEEAGQGGRALSVPPNELPLARVHTILERMAQEGTAAKRDAKKRATDEAGSDSDDKALQQSGAVSNAMQLTARLWARSKQAWQHGAPDARHATIPDVAAVLQPGKKKAARKRKANHHPQAQQGHSYVAWREEG